LLDLLVGFANVFSGADDGVGDPLDVAFLEGNLRRNLAIVIGYFPTIFNSPSL
jgi:hypothetical protein